jgi:hypothetical protein
MPPLYGCETHMLIVAEIVIGNRFCTSPAYVLHAKYWVVDWAWPITLKMVALILWHIPFVRFDHLAKIPLSPASSASSYVPL